MIDAATCLGFGLLLTAGSGWLGQWLGLPVDLLFYAGLILFPCAALMTFTGRQPTPGNALVLLIILGNLGWVAASLGVLMMSFITPTVPGYGFVILQAIAVGMLAVIEHRMLGASNQMASA
ncbi:hypothetical protein TH30_16515 [Thalassospira profundimaris]|uniref:Uncharacterized protein n=2 Tax=Thalassospira profundimaris TaxID=502049 RepID=A0A367WR72_9PROT|nr:hypothetical protein TH30_16515 [Thalassospira profundimaris]